MQENLLRRTHAIRGTSGQQRVELAIAVGAIKNLTDLYPVRSHTQVSFIIRGAPDA